VITNRTKPHSAEVLPVSLNAELFETLLNKVERRYEYSLKIATSRTSHAWHNVSAGGVTNLV
jgi:hypothetical protein